MEQEFERSPSIEFVAINEAVSFPFNQPADFIIRTVDNKNYHVSAVILGLASPYFQAIIQSPQYTPNSFILEVPESSATIETVLRSAYPFPNPVLYDLDDLVDAYVASRKYKVAAAEDAMAKMLSLPRFIEREPHRVYAIARRFGLDAEANVAAKHACKTATRDWPHCAEFDHITGSQHHALFAYHKARGDAAKKLIEKAAPLVLDGGCCKRCGWDSSSYCQQAMVAIVAAPTSEQIFTQAFVEKSYAGVSPGPCTRCLSAMFRSFGPTGCLTKLKKKIDSMRIDVVSSRFPCPPA